MKLNTKLLDNVEELKDEVEELEDQILDMKEEDTSNPLDIDVESQDVVLDNCLKKLYPRKFAKVDMSQE